MYSRLRDMVEVDISIIFAGLSIGASIVYYASVLRNQNQTRQAQLYMTLFNAINNEDFWKLENEIKNYTFSDFEEFVDKYGPISNPVDYAKIEKVLWILTQMGNLVFRGRITLLDVGTLIGHAPIGIWQKYGYVVEGLRENYYDTKEGHLSFEYLAKNMKERYDSGASRAYVEAVRQSIPDVEIFQK